ncbi:DUF2523 family protein [Chromobacterium sp. IIBBL 290-4]|uniref:DUF2523 family protein n=1 Tax=Chromobacterium sp. IIBBL 290-4 TaxID=2953890 RepID=UPI0020B75A80|nr:DUF2523 family protein [Chromobacterium sp. IIBBL 290-4]UTH73582.1 hypothetical protein NKT35_18875 [Chromobacterium sp. IIBBL 290-4]
MWVFLQSAIWTALAWMFREVVIKFVIVFAMFWLVRALTEVIVYALPDVKNINSLLAALPAGVWYYASLFQLQWGVPLIMSAWMSRFLIRRLPFIG